MTSKPYIHQGNGKVLMDYIQTNPNMSQYRINLVNHDIFNVSGSILNKISIIYQILQAKYIFVEDHYKLIENLNFNKETEIIQLWHAAGAYKKVGYSRFGSKNGPSLYKNAHRKYTKAIVSSEKLIPYYAEAYGIAEECIIATGLPRIERFMEQKNKLEVVEELYYTYPQFINKKIILFAPTFREEIRDGKKHYYYDYSKIDLESLYDFCNQEYICIFKFHPFISEKMQIPKSYQDRFIDMTHYSKGINNLLYITDILITDYSSVIFEFSLLRRPILIFAYDLKEYEEDRGMYQSLKSFAKEGICTSFDAILEKLNTKQLSNTYETVFKSAFDNREFNACEKIIQAVFKEEEL